MDGFNTTSATFMSTGEVPGPSSESSKAFTGVISSTEYPTGNQSWSDDFTQNTSAATEALINIGQLPAMVLANRIWTTAPPIIIFFGGLGNMMSVYVMSRERMRGSVTSVYLIFLAFIDTCVLLTGYLRYWIRALTNTDVRTLSSLSCPLHIFLVYFFGDMAGWTLVCVTLERFVSVYFPHKAKIWYTHKTVAASMISILLLLLLVNGHFFWTFRLSSEAETHSCTIVEQHVPFISLQWTWIDFTFYSLGPFTLILLGNIGILIKLTYVRYRQKRSNISTGVKITSMTAILLVISFMYLVTTAPISIYLIIINAGWFDDVSPYTEAGVNLAWAVVNMLNYINNAINFILYCVSGPRFRRELLSHFCPGKLGVVPTQASQTMELRITAEGSRQQVEGPEG